MHQMAHEIDSDNRAKTACSGEEPSSPETAEPRFVGQVRDMLRDAVEGNAMEELVEAFTWGLANVANRCGIEATGEIIQHLGRHICDIAEQDRARDEVEEARQKGEAFQ